MNKIFFISSLILLSSNLFSQNKISFKKISENNSALDRTFKKYQIIEINDEMHSISDGVVLTFNYGKDYSFVLHENKLLASDYTVDIKKENGIESKNVYDLGFDGKYFNNKNSSSNHQLAFSTFENKYTIYVKDFENEFYIEPLQRYSANASANQYVYYEAQDVYGNSNLVCGNQDEIKKNVDSNVNMNPNLSINTIVPIEVNFCVDYPMYTDYNSVTAVINRNLEVLNATQLDYSIANGLAYDVNFIVKKHYIITCNNCNYWESTTSVTTNMNEFQLNMYNGSMSYKLMFNNYSADVKILWLGSYDPLTNYNGISALNRLLNCVDTQGNLISATATLKNFSTNLNLTRTVLSHELGHSFGCPHVNDYQNNIMFGGSYNTHVWDPSSITIINYTIANSNCWSNNIPNICDGVKVNDLTLTVNNLNKMININWTPEVGKEYKVRLYNFTSDSWTSAATYAYPINSTSYNYNNVSTACSTKYKVEIIPTCSGIDGISQTLLFTVPANASPALTFQSTTQDEILCSGLNYTFTVAAQYPGTNPVYQWKVNNINVGVNSSSYSSSTLQNNDILSCQITSNEPCLTSQTVNVSKTIAVAAEPCSLSDTEFNREGIEFFPNPVTNQFTIKANDIIKNVSIYNVLGQKLFNQKNNNSIITIDMSSFPKSGYFVKIEIDNRVSTIKIIKE